MPAQTPSQTVGPFFSHALTPGPAGRRAVAGNRLADAMTPGPAIRIEGRVADGAGDPVPDAMIEIWQADHRGDYPDGSQGFSGFGRASTDATGTYWFRTVKPGSPAGAAAPHVCVAVFARGMLNHAFTRIYFADETAANDADPLLASLEADRRATLVASRIDGPGVTTYEFNIRLQGVGETVFLDA